MAIACILFIAIAATISFAGIAANQYTGCLDANGNLRNVNIGTEPAMKCNPNEKIVTWNELGQQGEQGLKGDKGDTGPEGVQGPQGVKGDTGPAGTNGISGIETIMSQWVTVPASGTHYKEVAAYCPSGKVPLGGGGITNRIAYLVNNIPVYYTPGDWTGDGWAAGYYNPNSYDVQMRAYVICANAQ